VIGQPVDGDHGTAWRDNARVQYRNCIFMDLGERLVAFDNVDGDGGAGYGFNGTLSWANTWTTDYNASSTVPNAPANPAAFYPSQVDGKLAEISDSVFYRNLNASAYTEATTRGVFNAGNNNVLTADGRGPGAVLHREGQQPRLHSGGRVHRHAERAELLDLLHADGDQPGRQQERSVVLRHQRSERRGLPRRPPLHQAGDQALERRQQRRPRLGLQRLDLDGLQRPHLQRLGRGAGRRRPGRHAVLVA
jgi:hypothetical protein